MRLLLDTHVFLWLQAEPERLGSHIGAVEDPGNELLLSAASSWEIAIKTQLGKLALPDDPERYVPDRMGLIGANHSPPGTITLWQSVQLPLLHRDPFDRMLVAQARDLRLTIITADPDIPRYEVETLLV